MIPLSISRSLRAYLSMVQTLRDQARTERLSASMPQDVRRDICWPDRFGEAVCRW